MAVDLNKLKEQHKMLDTAPISAIEAQHIKDVENFIDNEITTRFTSDTNEIWIDLSIVNFEYNPIKKKAFEGLTSSRKQFLRKQLLKPYEDFGWKFSYHIDDGLDGPNRSGGDYFIFKTY